MGARTCKNIGKDSGKNYPNSHSNPNLQINNATITENDNRSNPNITKEVKKVRKFSNDQPTTSDTLTKVSNLTTNLILRYVSGSLCQDIRKIYKFKEVLGGGHFGSVRIGYRKNEEPKRYYAIKSIPKRSLTNQSFDDLIREVEIISSLKHPNIIKFYETYYDKSYFHIVMEFCSGKDFFERIVEHKVISEKIVAKIIMKVLHAISYCHSKGFTHRDLKPENILFETDDIEAEIKLIDFGLARKFDANEKMSTILGTPYYIAPEVLKGEYDEKCDVWSIGVMTYIMLSGDFPFQGTNNSELFNKIVTEDINFDSKDKWSHISNEAKDFIMACMKKSPEKRTNASKALDHPWFSSILKHVHSENILHEKILNNIRSFSSPHKLKTIVLNWIVNTLCPKEIVQLKDAFYDIDLSHTGYIDIDELESAYKNAGIFITQEELETIVARTSNPLNNRIEYSHFLVASVDQEEILDKDKLTKAFKYFDCNNDGFIDADDLRNSLLRGGYKIINTDEEIKYMIYEVSKHSHKISLENFWIMFDYI